MSSHKEADETNSDDSVIQSNIKK